MADELCLPWSRLELMCGCTLLLRTLSRKYHDAGTRYFFNELFICISKVLCHVPQTQPCPKGFMFGVLSLPLKFLVSTVIIRNRSLRDWTLDTSHHFFTLESRPTAPPASEPLAWLLLHPLSPPRASFPRLGPATFLPGGGHPAPSPPGLASSLPGQLCSRFHSQL